MILLICLFLSFMNKYAVSIIKKNTIRTIFVRVFEILKYLYNYYIGTKVKSYKYALPIQLVCNLNNVII